MAVKKKPKQHQDDITSISQERFISGSDTPAPIKAKKITASLRFTEDLLAKIDATATRRGMSRNAIISYWCSKGVESE